MNEDLATGQSMDAPSVTRAKVWATGDTGLRRRMINIGHLLSGNGITGAVALVGVALTARSLGPAEYGVLALVVSYVRVFDRLLRFESWQPVIKYAADADHAGEDRRERLRTLFAFGLWLDGAACLAAAVSASLLAWLLAPLFGMSDTHIALVLINSAALLFNISGTPTAVLRLAGRYRTIAYAQVVGNILRVALCAIGLWAGGGLIFFITAWTVAQIATSLLFLYLSLAELRRQEIGALHRVKLRGITGRFPGIMSFAWSSSLSVSIRTSSMELDVLIVGALADPRSAGLYFVAKQVAKVVQQVCAQVQAVLYPDVARLWAKGAFQKFRRAIIQVQIVLDLFAVGAIATIALCGPTIIALAMGKAFAPAFPLLIVQMFALAFTMHAAPLRSALLAMGEQRAVLRIVLWSTMVFQVVAFALVPRIGAMGANIAHIALAVISAIAMERALRTRFKTALSENSPRPGSG